MRSFLSILSSAALLLAAAQQVAARAEDVFKKARVIERRNPGTPFQHPKLAKRAEQFLNNKTQSFAVNGTGIPEVPFDIGESYAGLLPISGAANETRELFFWFFPTTNPNKTEELTIWFNGGPGCSSLSGLLTENGPFTWEAGTLAPVQNPYTWVNLTNVVWVEQPVGTGFTQGKPNITNEYELGDQFIGFYKNFVDLFDLHSWKVYLTGESYAGYYVPYIANSFIGANDTDYYNLKGIAINDPIIGDETIQQQIVLKPYVDYWQNVIYLNSTYREHVTKVQKDCGYADYLEKYFTFPAPNGTFAPPADPYATNDTTCDLFDDLYSAILEVNPCFNIYHITETCPHPYSVLGIVNTGDYDPPGSQIYFNRTDVKKAINAPVDANWEQCGGPVFAGRGNDYSDGPAQNGVLQRVIEHTNNVIIGSGNLDFLLSTNGTLFTLQNVTWNGQQGFTQYPSQNDFFVPYHPEYNGGALSGSGIVGSWGTERGLTFYQVQLAGHELPGYAPGAGYRSLELLLGRIKDLSEGGDFTTQSGNFTGTAATYKGRFNNIIT